MAATKNQIEEALQKTFPAAEIIITDLAGDNEHWSVSVKDAGFAGKNRIAQHKEVQQAVAALDIHALQIKTVSN